MNNLKIRDGGMGLLYPANPEDLTHFYIRRKVSQITKDLLNRVEEVEDRIYEYKTMKSITVLITKPK